MGVGKAGVDQVVRNRELRTVDFWLIVCGDTRSCAYCCYKVSYFHGFSCTHSLPSLLHIQQVLLHWEEFCTRNFMLIYFISHAHRAIPRHLKGRKQKNNEAHKFSNRLLSREVTSTTGHWHSPHRNIIPAGSVVSYLLGEVRWIDGKVCVACCGAVLEWVIGP